MVSTSTETIKLIRDGENGGVDGGGGGIYLSPHCHQQKVSYIKTGSIESHFNVSLIVRDKGARQSSHFTIFLKRRESRSRIEPTSLGLPG